MVATSSRLGKLGFTETGLATFKQANEVAPDPELSKLPTGLSHLAIDLTPRDLSAALAESRQTSFDIFTGSLLSPAALAATIHPVQVLAAFPQTVVAPVAAPVVLATEHSAGYMTPRASLVTGHSSRPTTPRACLAPSPSARTDLALTSSASSVMSSVRNRVLNGTLQASPKRSRQPISPPPSFDRIRPKQATSPAPALHWIGRRPRQTVSPPPTLDRNGRVTVKSLPVEPEQRPLSPERIRSAIRVSQQRPAQTPTKGGAVEASELTNSNMLKTGDSLVVSTPTSMESISRITDGSFASVVMEADADRLGTVGWNLVSESHSFVLPAPRLAKANTRIIENPRGNDDSFMTADSLSQRHTHITRSTSQPVGALFKGTPSTSEMHFGAPRGSYATPSFVPKVVTPSFVPRERGEA